MPPDERRLPASCVLQVCYILSTANMMLKLSPPWTAQAIGLYERAQALPMSADEAAMVQTKLKLAIELTISAQETIHQQRAVQEAQRAPVEASSVTPGAREDRAGPAQATTLHGQPAPAATSTTLEVAPGSTAGSADATRRRPVPQERELRYFSCSEWCSNPCGDVGVALCDVFCARDPKFYAAKSQEPAPWAFWAARPHSQARVT